MTRAIQAALFVALLPVSLHADSWGPPTPSVHVSENAALIVRVEPGFANSDGSGSKSAHCRFFRYSEEKKMYEFWREHDLVNAARPCSLVIPDDGSFLVTFDDYMGIGTSENTVVVYDASGRMIKKWALNDILSESEIEELPHSTMSIHWRGDVGVMMSRQKEVYISAPKSPFKSDDYKYFKGFLLDTNSLTIREDPEHKRWAEWRRSEDARLDRSHSLSNAFTFWRLIAIVEGVILAAAAIVLALQKKRLTSNR